jgi:hypothetical protein
MDARKAAVAAADIFFISLSDSDHIEIRDVDFIEARLTSSSFSTLTTGYRVVDLGHVSVDLLAGGALPR